MRKHQFLLFRVYRFHDATAYGKLYELYRIEIDKFVVHKVPRTVDAEEIASEVFLRCWEYATSNRVENIRALYYKVARNLIADFYRKRKIEESLTEAADIELKSEIVSDLIVKEEVEEINGHIDNLKGDLQDVITMKYINEMSVSEIAEALDKTPNNIRVILHRARKELKRMSDK